MSISQRGRGRLRPNTSVRCFRLADPQADEDDDMLFEGQGSNLEPHLQQRGSAQEQGLAQAAWGGSPEELELAIRLAWGALQGRAHAEALVVVLYFAFVGGVFGHVYASRGGSGTCAEMWAPLAVYATGPTLLIVWMCTAASHRLVLRKRLAEMIREMKALRPQLGRLLEGFMVHGEWRALFWLFVSAVIAIHVVFIVSTVQQACITSRPPPAVFAPPFAPPVVANVLETSMAEPAVDVLDTSMCTSPY